MIQDRCWWYDPHHGIPYLRVDGKRGCERNYGGRECTFAHPDDPDQWAAARPSLHLPYPHLLAPSERRHIQLLNDQGAGFRARSANRRHSPGGSVSLHTYRYRHRSSSRPRSNSSRRNGDHRQSKAPRRRSYTHSRSRTPSPFYRRARSRGSRHDSEARRRSPNRERGRDHTLLPSVDRANRHRLPSPNNSAIMVKCDNSTLFGSEAPPLKHPLPTRPRDLHAGHNSPRATLTASHADPHLGDVRPALFTTINEMVKPEIPVSFKFNLKSEPSTTVLPAAGATQFESPLSLSSSAIPISPAASPVPPPTTASRSTPIADLPSPAVVAHPPTIVPSSYSSLSHSSTGASPASATQMPSTALPNWTPVTSTVQAVREASPDMSKLNPEGKRKVWEERINILASATAIRAEFQQLDRELHAHKRITESAQFTTLSEDERTSVHARVADLLVKRISKGEELKTFLLSLSECNYWPLDEEKAQLTPALVPTELAAQIGEIKEAVRQVNELLQAISERVHAPVDEDQTPVELDLPNKRRRLLVPATGSTEGVSSLSSTEVMQQIELEDLQGKFSVIEERLAEMERAFRSHEDEVREEAHTLIQENIQHRNPTPEPTISQERLVALENEYKTAGEQVEELSQEMAKLILEADAVRKRNAFLMLENEALRQHIEETHVQQKGQLEEMEREMRAMKEIATAHLNSVLPPVPVLALDEILSAVQPLLLQTVRQELQPTLQAIHRNVEDMLHVHSEQLSSAIIPKLNLTLQMVETIRAWSDRIGLSGGAASDGHALGRSAH